MPSVISRRRLVGPETGRAGLRRRMLATSAAPATNVAASNTNGNPAVSTNR